MGWADTRGTLVYSGRRVRMASDEPTPDPKSPGLNLVQVDTALYRLSDGAINLDTQYRYPFPKFQRDLIDGKWAVLQVERGVFVDAGLGGKSPFRLGHAVAVGYDQNLRKPLLGDPLNRDWLPVTWDTLEEAAGALVFNRARGTHLGKGLVYAAFSRDVYTEPSAPPPKPVRYSVFIQPGAVWVYDVDARGRITGRTSREFRRDTSAPAAAPRRYAWPAQGSSRRLVRVTAGALAGRYVQPGAAHVTLKETR